MTLNQFGDAPLMILSKFLRDLNDDHCNGMLLMLHWFSFEVNDALCYCKHISLHTNLYSAGLVNIYKPIMPHNYIMCFVHAFVWYISVLQKTIVKAI